jgi:formimidoylglutamate deiminase
MTTAYVIEADLTWTGEAFRSGIQVVVGADGLIANVGELGQPVDVRLRGEALMPGFVNVHSHAFQRALRGRGERFPAGAGSFWTWRGAMYSLVQGLGAEAFYAVSLQAFREMLRSGITTVGEFHYFHHAREPEMDWNFDRLILRAARETGIRLVLLNTYYRTGGIGRRREPAQLRFDGGSPAAYWAQMDALAAELTPETQHLGAAAHSVRAVSPDEIAALHAEATRRGLVFHLHLEEQRQEVDECFAAFGRRPMALLNEIVDTASNITAVHCTHTAADDMRRFLAQGGGVCVCPLTEGNLGDGIPDLAQVLAADNRLSLGTDSNARIAMPEEMRWLEYAQRLRAERRGVLAPEDGDLARVLLQAALRGGARALGLDAGRLAPGALADFATIDLAAPELDGCDEDMLAAALVTGAGASVIRRTCVAGRWHGAATDQG